MNRGASPSRWKLHVGLLTLWFAASFGVVFFARDLQWQVFGWPVGFWLAAQGSVFIFIFIVVVFAWVENRRDAPETGLFARDYAAYKWKLHRRFALYVFGLLSFLFFLALAERWGLPKVWVSGIFLSATLLLYAGIGIYSRTTVPAEYYVASRRIPSVYNGMATAADWMSAASFISLAGGLYLQGFSGDAAHAGGLTYVLGWTGGFCLLALWVVPYLRRMEIYTLPDFFAKRFGGHWPRLIAALAAVLCSFTYVVAQIYGVGLITSRLIGVNFEIGILMGLGGVLVCSFLGGMRAVTWTQVTQYVVIILAFLIPVSWLAYKQVGNPLAPFVYGQQLYKIAAMEQQLMQSPQEQEVIDEYAKRAQIYKAKLLDVGRSLQEDRKKLRNELAALGDFKPNDARAAALRKELSNLPKNENSAREKWTSEAAENLDRARPLAGMPVHATAFDGDPHGSLSEQNAYEYSRLNSIALMFCLMLGTLGLPHLLTRYYTTPTVAEARNSVAWSLIFIALLYISAPALAVMVKYEVMAHLVGQPFDQLPTWVAQWARDPSLLVASDVNGDGILQFAELKMGANLVLLATPEIGGLPYVVSVLVAAGGLAAALSTADGLLLTIGNALVHDTFPESKGDKLHAMRRVMWSKFALLVVALIAAYGAGHSPAGIVYLVTASFSMAGASLVPVMVLGIFWSGTTRAGAVGGMLTGLAVTVYYLVMNLSAVRAMLHLSGDGLWWGIAPVSAGVFGFAAGLLVAIGLSLATRPKTNSQL